MIDTQLWTFQYFIKGSKGCSGLRAKSSGWIRKENYFQVKNFNVRKPSLRIAGFVTSKYESSILTLKITWLQHTFDSDQTKTNLLSWLFWSKGKAISKYKDRLYFLVNFKIDFAQLYRARKKIIFLAQVPKPLLLTIMPKSRLSFILLLELLLFKLIVWLSSRWNWTPHPSSCASREESSVREDFFKMQSGPQHKQNRPVSIKQATTADMQWHLEWSDNLINSV